MNINKILISAFLGFVLFAGVRAFQLEQSELVEIILKIEAIGHSKEPSVEEASWLLEIIKSSDLVMHEAVFYDDGRGDRLLYSPPSHHAIWSLSRILAAPPYTYEDENWKSDGFYMTGERKRWIEWSRDNPVKLKSTHANEPIPANLADEKRRQTENRRLNLEMSYREARLAAGGTPTSFFELERLYVEGKDLPGNPAPFAPESSLNGSAVFPSEVLPREGAESSAGINLGNGGVELKDSAMSLFWIIASAIVIGVGFLLLVLRRNYGAK